MKLKWIFIPPLAILAMVLFVVVGGEIVMRLWNWLLPVLFGWRSITFWQAVGLLALCRILFGGSRWRGPGPYSSRRSMRTHIEDRCWRRTPEEREEFRQRMRERWGFGASTCENQAQ